MILVGKYIIEELRTSLPEVSRRIYAAIVPQDVPYPNVLVRTLGVEPTHAKHQAGRDGGRMGTEAYFISISVYSFDPLECAQIAAKVRDRLDRRLAPDMKKGIGIVDITFESASEDGFREDKVEIITWDLNFKVTAYNVC